MTYTYIANPGFFFGFYLSKITMAANVLPVLVLSTLFIVQALQSSFYRSAGATMPIWAIFFWAWPSNCDPVHCMQLHPRGAATDIRGGALTQVVYLWPTTDHQIKIVLVMEGFLFLLFVSPVPFSLQIPNPSPIGPGQGTLRTSIWVEKSSEHFRISTFTFMVMRAVAFELTISLILDEDRMGWRN